MPTFIRQALHGPRFLSALILVGTAASGLCAGTAIGIVWSKSQVLPIVLVRPDTIYGGFVPTQGDTVISSNRWTKDEVTGKQEMCYIIIEYTV